jgi:hypothetical protein
MILIIKEYLSMLKESKELDAILPDLLLTMGIEPLTKPQIGVRQDGVDIAAYGELEGINTILLFVIKQGDISRTDWDGSQQSIRPTLDEVIDVYIKNRIPPQYDTEPIKIILTTGGNRKQEIDTNWTGYTSRNTNDRITFDFWGGDKLSSYIVKFMMNENLFPIEAKKYLRKSLALVGEPDYDVHDFYLLIDKLLEDINSTQINQIIKKFRTINLCLFILFYWSIEENNLKPAYLSAEYVLLKCWNYIHKNNLSSNNQVLECYMKYYNSYAIIFHYYYGKIRDHFYVEGALNRYCTDANNFCILIFEQIGILSVIGLIQLSLYEILKKDESKNNALEIINSLKNIISKYGITSTPFYDGHMIDICLGLILLYHTDEIDFIKEWISNIANNSSYAYKKGKYFPIDIDDYNSLIELNEEGSIDKAELMKMSTLMPMLAEWCVVCDFNDLYCELVEIQKKLLNQTCYQLWYPDDEAINQFYQQNAAKRMGTALAPITLPDSITDLKSNIKQMVDKEKGHDELSSYKLGIVGLEFIAYRHYRTPVIPSHWEKLIDFN